MISIKGTVVYFDIDNTLCFWDLKEGFPTISIPVNDKENIKVSVHLKHVDDIKKHKARGHKVVLWTAGGAEWGELVCKYLELDNYIDLIISKPNFFYDDLESKVFMPEHNRIYRKVKEDV